MVTVTAFGTIARATEATREGAFCLGARPLDRREVLRVAAGETDAARFSDQVGRCPRTRHVVRRAAQVAASSRDAVPRRRARAARGSSW